MIQQRSHGSSSLSASLRCGWVCWLLSYLDGDYPTPPSVFAIGYAGSLVQAIGHHSVSEGKVEGKLDAFLPHPDQVKQARNSCVSSLQGVQGVMVILHSLESFMDDIWAIERMCHAYTPQTASQHHGRH